MLELRDVTKTVGAVEHICDVSLTLQHGSLNVLLGPTLSGKTSLMRLMAGLQGGIGPKMAEEHDLAYWNANAVKGGNLAPQLKLEQEKDKPITINYDELVKSWQK